MEDNFNVTNEILKLKKDELDYLTNQLKSHYFLEEFFVDPDQKFLKLLERVIHFFEDDDFVQTIKENEHKYVNFKKKYESAVELIKTIEEEKEKLQNALKKKNTSLTVSPSVCGKLNNYFPSSSGYNFNHQYVYESPRFLKSSEFNLNNNNTNTINNSNVNMSKSPLELKKPVNISQRDFDKFKEDYFQLYEEKKALEGQLVDYIDLQRKYSDSNNSLISLQAEFDNINERYSSIIEEKKNFQERLNRFAKENFELMKNITNIKEALNLSEKEKNTAKNKIAIYVNKLKFLEKESGVMKKKNQSLKNQIKNLTEKIISLEEDKNRLDKRNEDNLNEFENKLAGLENEKNKMIKDSLSLLINSINDEKFLIFKYEKEGNKIQLFFEGEKIGEAENYGNVPEQEQCQSYRNRKSQPNPYDSVLNFKGDFVSPSKKVEQKTYPLPPNPGFSLKQLFSKSRSEKSYENKENINNNTNHFKSKSKSNSKLLISNLSSTANKKQRTEAKLPKIKEEDNISSFDMPNELPNKQFTSINNNPFIFNFNINNASSYKIEKIDSCIKKTNLNDSIRYVISSSNNNRHKKVVSLEEAIGTEIIGDLYNANNINKRLNFLSIGSASDFEISANIKKRCANQLSRAENMSIR